jgi:hypothetical protein
MEFILRDRDSLSRVFPLGIGVLAVTAGLLSFSTSASAQISLVNVTPCGPQVFPGTTCTIPATASGHLIVVAWASAFGTNPTIASVTDSAGNRYSEAGAAKAFDSSANEIVDIWYAINSTSGATTVTITPSPTGTGAALIWEFSGVNTTSPLDQTVVLNSQPATTSASGGPVTTTAANEVIISAMNPSSSTIGLQSGSAFNSDGLLYGLGWAHLITSSIGTYSAQWSISSGTYASSTVSFKGASSGSFSACDLNQDGVVNSLDANLAVSMILTPATCDANIVGAGVCNVVVVQRVVNAGLPGGTCLPGNSHMASLTWTASTSPNVTYNVYRGTSPGSYTKLNSTSIGTTNYTDSTVQAGQTYYYVATAVDVSGNESAYSSPPATAIIPYP